MVVLVQPVRLQPALRLFAGVLGPAREINHSHARGAQRVEDLDRGGDGRILIHGIEIRIPIAVAPLLDLYIVRARLVVRQGAVKVPNDGFGFTPVRQAFASMGGDGPAGYGSADDALVEGGCGGRLHDTTADRWIAPSGASLRVWGCSAAGGAGVSPADRALTSSAAGSAAPRCATAARATESAAGPSPAGRCPSGWIIQSFSLDGSLSPK